jgi:hypothetical protein
MSAIGICMPLFALVFAAVIFIVCFYYRGISVPFFKYLLDNQEDKTNSSEDDARSNKETDQVVTIWDNVKKQGVKNAE